MNLWLLVTPLFSALLGWFFTKIFIWRMFRPYFPQNWIGFHVQGIIPSRQSALSARVGSLLSEQLISSGEIAEKILDPASLQKIIPEIEVHIDYFLRVKLKDAMPMVAMFVGDKTIVQLKEIFMTEMITLFPEIMKSYVNELQKGLDIREKITTKLASLPAEKIESFFLQTLGKELRYVQLAGAFLGLTIGVFQLIIILIVRS